MSDWQINCRLGLDMTASQVPSSAAIAVAHAWRDARVRMIGGSRVGEFLKIAAFAAAVLVAEPILASTHAPITPLSVGTSAIPLYGSRTPGDPRSEINDGALFGHPSVRNVTYPTLTPVMPPRASTNGAAVIVLPGGGFMGLSMEPEGWEVARALNSRGIKAFVLKYRLLATPKDPAAARQALMDRLTAHSNDPNRQVDLKDPEATEDALAAIAMVRAHAKEWGIDPARIGLLGFSAGAMAWLEAVRTAKPGMAPAFVGYIYGPQSRIEVPAEAPPLFDAIAFDDPLFSGSRFEIASAWREAKRPVELHVYQTGGHGFGLGRPGTTTELMLEQFVAWLSMQGFLSPKATQ